MFLLYYNARASAFSIDKYIFFSVHNIKTPVVVAYIAQGVLGAVLGAVVGTRDPEQVNMLAKQAGEVCSRPY